MFLTIMQEKADTTSNNVEFELVANDLLMISIDNDTGRKIGSYSYWRLLGDGKNPPLEVGINVETNMIKEITLFVEPDYFEDFQLVCESKTEGNLIVDTSIFHKQYDFIDASGNYFVSLIDERFACKFNKECRIKESIINGNIEMYVDDCQHFIGFAINNLTETEKDVIRLLLSEDNEKKTAMALFIAPNIPDFKEDCKF